MSDPYRRSVRLRDFDYAGAGAYFMTICTFDRACLFGEIVDGEMRLNELGAVVREEWENTARVRPNVTLDAYVVMPNHFHAIIVVDCVGATRWVAPDNVWVQNRATHRVAPTSTGLVSGSLGAIVGQFKSVATKRINMLRDASGQPVWQRNFHEHIIRNDHDLAAVRDYIAGNPARWIDDENHPISGIST